MNLGAERRQHLFGVIAGQRMLRNPARAFGFQRRQQQRRFHLGGGHRHVAGNRRGIRRADHRHRHQGLGPLRLIARAKPGQGIEHSRHRPRTETGIAGERGADRRGRHRAHHQPRSGAGISEIQGAIGLAPAARARHPPKPLAVAGHFGPQRPDGIRRIQDVLGF